MQKVVLGQDLDVAALGRGEAAVPVSAKTQIPVVAQDPDPAVSARGGNVK